jgi:hypothetical protein
MNPKGTVKRSIYERVHAKVCSQEQPRTTVLVGFLLIVFGLLLLYNAYFSDIEAPIEIANVAILLVGTAMIFV